MNVSSKYYRWYLNIIQRSIEENRIKGQGIYYEAHHIVPLSLGGIDNLENIVLLTGKEHVICHHLLTKFTDGKDKAKMYYAFWSLVNGWGKYRDGMKLTARQYSNLKEEISKQISTQNSGKTPPILSNENREKFRRRMSEKNPMKGLYGKENPNFGRKRPGIGGRKKGTKWSDVEREKHMKVRSRPGYYDYFSNPERSKKISESQKGRKGTSTGTVWYNDGTKEFQGVLVPDGFVKGRLITNKSKKGLKWFNNGLINKQYREGSQPKGFLHGRINKK
jgi:hypothetical protein